MFFIKTVFRDYFSRCRIRFRFKWAIVKEIHEGEWFFRED